MHLSRHILLCFFVLAVCWCGPLYAQLGFAPDIKKPKPYENRVLQSEKPTDKKFKISRRFMQNTTTHYNYFFNANNKINEIIEKAKAVHVDDYSTLLSFYNYSLEATAQDKTELDSVIYKAQTGIVQHDIRNNWNDNLYLLWGAAYYFQQQFDSARQMFQFINYAYADKEKDGYYKYIGSHMDGNNALSISTKEDPSFTKKLLSKPPSRNDALIWQIRTLIQMDRFPTAASLITTLKNDPNFPERLNSSLEEIQAYWFYKQQMWDSTAIHLVKSLGNATTQQEKARWEYLAGQLFERSNKLSEAEDYYTKSMSHTTDPVMDIYARLNLIRINKAGGNNYIDQNIAELVKMAKKDKYADYRDVIYFMAAQMEMARNNPVAAQEYILKGAKYSNHNLASRNQSYLQLADLLFKQKKYKPAASFYDSLDVNTIAAADVQRVSFRKEVLTKLVSNLDVVDRQDSLQRIAALPEDQRKAIIKKLVREMRNQQGLKDEGIITSATVTPLPDPFRSQNKGEWYFYNTTLKTQGSVTFKQVWGNRPNIDNWRRYSNVTAALRNNSPDNTRGDNLTISTANGTAPTTDVLMGNLPLTAPQLQSSNDSIQMALFTAGNMYANELEDYESAIATMEALRKRFPQFANMSDVIFQLYYSYSKTGNTARAAEFKKLLIDKYPESRYATIITKGIDPTSKLPTAEVTKTYEHVYDLFIEGSFAEAEAAKKQADSIYHTNYWSPQLLYIEAVYHAKQRQDSTAKQILNTLINQEPNGPLAEKAGNLLQVLNRRKQIEEELTNLQIERPKGDTAARIVSAPVVKPKPVATTDSAVVKKETEPSLPSLTRDTTALTTKDIAGKKPTNKPVIDALSKKPLTTSGKKPASIYTYNTEAPHYAVIILNKVDVVFGNEAKNAFSRYNHDKYGGAPLDMQLVDIDSVHKLLVIGNFSNELAAINYVQTAKPLASTQIVPWLKSDKYTFTIISESNLEVLKANPDLNKYQKFLDRNLPVKF